MDGAEFYLLICALLMAVGVFTVSFLICKWDAEIDEEIEWFQR